MKQPGTIEILRPEGAVKYEKLSSRLPRFLEEYNPKEGWRVITRALDPLSLRPGLMELYKATAAAGHKPEDVGLPPVKASAYSVFEAVLVDPQGNEVVNAHAMMEIAGHKDLEVCETAARQRLVAACGYHGAILDADEGTDMLRQGFVTDPDSRPEAAAAGTLPAPETVTPLRPPPQAGNAPHTKGKQPSAANDRTARTPAPAATRPAAPAKMTDKQKRYLEDLRVQIATAAKKRGIEPPAVSTIGDAKRELRKLLKPVRQTG